MNDTPESDEVFGPRVTGVRARKCRDIERRLTIAREALEIARVGMSCIGVPNAAEREVLNDAFDHVCETLKQIAP